MGREKNARYLEKALAPIPEGFSGSLLEVPVGTGVLTMPVDVYKRQAQLLCHPAASCEYVAVPLLLRCLQIADQLSVSAVARGAEAPGRRGSYYGKDMDAGDWLWLAIWTAVTTAFLWLGGMRI